MRLVRVAPAGSETPGVLVDDGTFVNVSDVVQDFNEAFFGSGMLATLDSIVTERVANGRTQPLGERRFGAPIARPHQILCIGLNYRDHAAETGQAVPTEPILTTSANSSLSSRETSSTREPHPGSAWDSRRKSSSRAAKP